MLIKSFWVRGRGVCISLYLSLARHYSIPLFDLIVRLERQDLEVGGHSHARLERDKGVAVVIFNGGVQRLCPR